MSKDTRVKNFVITDEVDRKLDELAEALDLSRSKVVCKSVIRVYDDLMLKPKEEEPCS